MYLEYILLIGKHNLNYVTGRGDQGGERDEVRKSIPHLPLNPTFVSFLQVSSPPTTSPDLSVAAVHDFFDADSSRK